MPDTFFPSSPGRKQAHNQQHGPNPSMNLGVHGPKLILPEEGTVPPPPFVPSLDFADERNSQYWMTVFF